MPRPKPVVEIEPRGRATPPTARRAAASLGAALGALAVTATGWAEEAPRPAPSPASVAATSASASAAPGLVRVALSAAAAEKMVEPRLRRLLELELPRSVKLAPGPIGALDEPALRVWVDLAGPTLVLVQVQAPGRRVEARRVDVAGLSWDVAARFVALAVSESVRGQLAPIVKKRPRPPTEAELLEAEAARPTLQTSASLVGAWLGSAGEGLLGSRLELASHRAPLGQYVSVSALGATGGGHWLELGVGAVHRPWLSRDVRAELGGGLGLAATTGLAGSGSGGDAGVWARATARAALEARLSGATWGALRLEPGVAFDAQRERAGAYLGAALAILVDAPTGSARRPAGATASTRR